MRRTTKTSIVDLIELSVGHIDERLRRASGGAAVGRWLRKRPFWNLETGKIWERTNVTEEGFNILYVLQVRFSVIFSLACEYTADCESDHVTILDTKNGATPTFPVKHKTARFTIGK
jgi:hypothetical protein